MYKDLDEEISVTVAFIKREMRPYRFYWRNRAVKVARFTATWKAPMSRSATSGLQSAVDHSLA
jgi:hypothetical protein